MTNSDIINIFSIISSLIVAGITIWISYKSLTIASKSFKVASETLQQSSQMIENQTRPYLTVYSGFLGYEHMLVYLILRNFGQGNAYIKKWHSETDLSKYMIPKGKKMPDPFAHIEGTTLAPGQSLPVPFDYEKLKQASEDSGHKGILKFSYVYEYNGKQYNEEAIVNIAYHPDHGSTSFSQKNSEPAAIADVANALHARNVYDL